MCWKDHLFVKNNSNIGTYYYVLFPDLYKIQLQHKLENMNAKTNILEVKTDSLVDSIEKEEANRERMIAVMPVKMKTSNSSESTATDAMKQAMGVLRDFYDSHHNGSI